STDSVIEVNGRDRPGFLHDVTAALLKLGLKISSAHILTYGERAVDVFYVKDVFGLKVTHDDKIEEIRERLMEAVGDAKTGERANSGDETVEAAE
ncbi:MAG: ACT domain-containing protein, partial [Rhodospirillaceae bacterium]|nr:ACT domain-containing protein [Rhodospirillaceae bacterium]